MHLFLFAVLASDGGRVADSMAVAAAQAAYPKLAWSHANE